MVSPYKIKYNGEFSTGLNPLQIIMCVAFDSDNGDVSTYLNRSAIASETYDGRYKRVHGYKYDESFSPKFTFTKSNFEDFTMAEVRKVLSWLTSTSAPSLLDVYYDDGEAIAWSAIGGWTEINTYKLANGRTVAITATFEAITPYAMSDIIHIAEFTSPATIPINLVTDEPQSAVYPRITIKTLSTTNVSIKNTYTNDAGVARTFEARVENNIQGETVVIDGANRVISSLRADGRIFGDDFNWQWIPLYEGDNVLTFIGDCKATIEYRYPIKCGEF